MKNINELLPEYINIPDPPERRRPDYLMISDLKLNETYVCRLSGKKVFITDIQLRNVMKRKCITGVFYANGKYRILDVLDYMLYKSEMK